LGTNIAGLTSAGEYMESAQSPSRRTPRPTNKSSALSVSPSLR
jgi:hypothetical protein